MRRPGALAALFILIAATAAAQPATEDGERIALVEQVKQSVVHVKAAPPPAKPRPKPARGRDPKFDQYLETMLSGLDQPKPQEGSGFVVDSRAGLILTAAHIVAGGGAVRVALPDGSERDAAVAGVDEETGIALLRVAGALPPALALSARDALAGETAMLVGWMLPLKSVLALEGMVTGAVPGAGAHNAAAPALVDYVALDIAIPNGGFGGAPVVDRSRKVVGLVSAIFGRDYGAGSLTLMIPARQIAPLIEPLAERGRMARGRIGIAIDCTPAPCAVTSVEPGSAAAQAGLKSDDRILAVDGLAVAGDVALRRAIATMAPGSRVVLRVQRDGRLLDVSVQTEARE